MVHSRALMHTRLRILLTGAVQGTGFRPCVYRLARELQLAGFVRNTTGGLHIEVEGEREDLRAFQDRLERERPPASVILSAEESWLEPTGATGFEILESEQSGSIEAAVLPDLATCPDCLAELRDPRERRFGYPFTNCTRCGPRFTIVLDLPYDRSRTVMDGFELCAACRREYEDPGDRRFHAQPIACPDCGPRLSIPIREAAEALRKGAIVALKGIGGLPTSLRRLQRDGGRAAARKEGSRVEATGGDDAVLRSADPIPPEPAPKSNVCSNPRRRR